ncbi:MAG: insulinase family protein [Bacilli bacterium]|nr:insulinase family protein [Bacilli bacterium]
MNKIKLKGLNETVVHEVLDNGLNVYVLRKKEFNAFSCYFITNFGALVDKFIPINEDEMIKFPKGIAHFLEHKMFEQEKGETVTQKFSSLGGSCNAFTNYDYTTYYVTGVDNFYENLNFLIDYVQSPYFTDDNVKKEQGIINQERLMINDNPYRIFYMKSLENIFVNYGYGKTIVGDEKDIYSITKEDLYRCYNTFYNPSNMSLLVVSNNKEEDVINSVKKNQEGKKFDRLGNIKIDEVIEPENVKKEYDVIYDNVIKTQISYAIKIKADKFLIDIDKALLYIYILIKSNFGEISKFNLDLKQKNIIDDNIQLGVSMYGDYIIINLNVSSDNEDKIIELFNKKFNDLNILEEDFNLIKKSMISKFVCYFMSVGSIMDYLYNDYFDNKKITGDTFIKYKELIFDEFKMVVEKFNINNKSITIMKPLKEKE